MDGERRITRPMYCVTTAFQENGNEPMLEEQMTYEAEPRSIVVLMGKTHPELEEEPKVRRTRREKHKNKVSTTKGQTP